MSDETEQPTVVAIKAIQREARIEALNTASDAAFKDTSMPEMARVTLAAWLRMRAQDEATR